MRLARTSVTAARSLSLQASTSAGSAARSRRFAADILVANTTGRSIILAPTSVLCRLTWTQTRAYSNPQPKKGFLQNLVNNIQDELAKNKELQDNKAQLAKRMQELNDSEALRDARKKYEVIEKETVKSSEVIRQNLEKFSEQMKKALAEVQKTEAGKKMLESARAAAEQLEKTAEMIGDTQVYKQVSNTVGAVKKEIDDIADVRMYSRPAELRKRTASTTATSKVFEANTEAQDVQLHKESRWAQGWKNFAENNAYYNRLLDWKNRYDESENVAVRIMRGITDRIQGAFSGSNEVSEVLTEIAKIDPSFDKIQFLRYCEKEVIPNILEAFLRGDLEVLQDWCHERAFVAMSTVVKENAKVHFSTSDSRVIDVSKVEMVSGKMMEQGPVLIITFQAFMINVVKNADGKVVQGDQNNPVRVHHVWVLCRDMEELNPAVAWKLLEVHMQEGALAI